MSSEQIGWSRRDFVRFGIGVAAAPTLLSCGGTDPSDPRIKARPGLPTLTPTVGQTTLGLGSGGRDGWLYVPATYSALTPAALFVGLHGAGGGGAAWTSYQARAEARAMVVLAIDSRGTTWDLLTNATGPDVDFLDKALKFAFDRCRIDPARVCLGGFSDGATMRCPSD